MPLQPNQLAAGLLADYLAIMGTPTPGQLALLTSLCNSQATTITNYIKTATIVAPPQGGTCVIQ